MKAYKELASHSLIYGLGTIIPRILNYGILTPLYTYNLSESNYGIFSEMYSYVAFLMVFLTFGLETTFFRYASKNEKNSSQIFNSISFILLITSSLFLILIFSFNNSISNILGYGDKNYLVPVVALIIFFDVLVTIPLAKLRLEGKALKFSVIRISNILINISLNIFFFVVCKNSQSEWLHSLYIDQIGVGYAFISNLAASFFNLLVLLPIIIKFRFNFNKNILKEIIWYSSPLVLVGLSGMVNEVSDKLFIKYLTVPTENALYELGVYSANYKLAILMTIFIQVFRYAAEPLFFKYSKTTEAKSVYIKSLNYFVIFCLLIFLFVTLNIPIIQYFIGTNFRSGLFIVPIILLANIFLGIYYSLSIWYKITDLTKYGAYISLVGVFITVVLNIILIPWLGYLGGAIATFFCYFIMMILSYSMGQRFYKVDYDLKSITIYFALAVFLFLLNKLLVIDAIILELLKANFLILLFVAIIMWYQKISIKNIIQFVKK